MIHFIRRSISRKFMLAVLVTTSSALLVAGGAMLAYEVNTYRAAWVNDLTTQSEILGQMTAPALEFGDPKVAEENLLQLNARPSITAAAIYDAAGRPFAVYRRKGVAAAVPAPVATEWFHIEGNRIETFKPIIRNEEKIGTVYIRAEYPLKRRVSRYLVILAAVMLASLAVAGLVSLWIQSAVTRPLLQLTHAVNEVIRRRNFSARVAKTTIDESGVLVDAFNTMLTEVGARTADLERTNQALQHEMEERREAEEALRHLNNTLEARIAARSAELEKTSEQLRHAQKMEAIGQLTGGVAHDFNNVLQVIAGNLQLLQMSLHGDADAQRRLDTAAMAADRGAKLSSQLLAFARRQPLQPRPTHLGRVVGAMDELLRRALGESIEIETIVAGGLWNTSIDPHQVENVILNLAINARDAMGGDGKLTVELGNAMLDDTYVAAEQGVTAGQYVMLAVSDTGCGMPPEVIERAFEPFFTTKPEGAGTGLGLSMAYGFVKQSNGHIRIYSEVGSGTTIKLYFPRCMQTEVGAPAQPVGPAEGGREVILVVEDDVAVQETTVDMLQGLGYRVLVANDGQSALHLLQSGVKVDLLFTDVVMPGPVRSTELAKQAKVLYPGIAVLFTSGYTQNAIVHGGRLDPGVELISKPYGRDELARKVRHVFAEHRADVAMHASPAAAVAYEGVRVNRPGRRILVVEDNDDGREMLCEMLKLVGHEIEAAASAEAALDCLERTSFEILLTDVTLPRMQGPELARQAVARVPGIKVVFVSGFGEVDPKQFDFKVCSLAKPYDLERLQAVLGDEGDGA